MNDIALVLRLDREAGRADVKMYPASCGRCDDPGHCTRTHREIPASVPRELVVSAGDHVRLAPSVGSLKRSVWTLLVVPALCGLGGYMCGTLLGASTVVPVGLMSLGAVFPIVIAVVRGSRREDWPVIVERLPGLPPPQFTGVPDFRNARVDPNRIQTT